MKFLSILLLLLNLSIYPCIILQSEQSILLKGTPISSDSSSKLISNPFDGDITTEFKSSDSTYSWIGLEFPSSYIITKIGWGQKENIKSNYILGVFEGSNDPNFFDALPLSMIVEEGKNEEINYINIKTTKSFKYVRYIGPNGKNSIISILEFYGYESKEDNIEKNEEIIYQPTNLPLIVINTENSVEPKDKETDIICQVSIINNGKEETKANGVIKLRGNSSFNFQKKPYKIKFDEKQKLLDLPAKAKKWNLMANYNDRTLLRTLLGLKISSLFELEFTASCTPVDIIFNGEFKGNYNLCDKIEFGKNRINLDELDETKNEEPEITGGYLLEATQYAYTEGFYLNTTRGIILGVRYPKQQYITTEQLQYIHNKFNQIESDAYNGIVDDIDFESFSKYLLVQELCGHSEVFWSTYMTKKRNDEKIYFGPVWDFDLAFDNDGRAYPTLNKTNFLFKYVSSAGTMREFAVKLLNNENLLQSVKDKWTEITKSNVTKEKIVKFIDEQAELINDSQKLNFMRWDILKLKRSKFNAKCTFEKEVEYLRDYIQKRFDLVGEIVRKATIVSVNEEVEHFDLDLINGGGHGKPQKGDGEHKGGKGGGKHNSNEIDEICLNVTNSFL